ncbi:MAG: Transcriptional regulator, TetR family [Labilithrix sp.]|nr:Transcriptional regulator, TetR family [Labilithrix sp.]
MMSSRGRMTALYESFLRKAPKQARSRVLVEAVLDSAIDLVSREDGEARTTVQEVAERAGIGIGSLYDWFEDRSSVLAGVVARVTARNLQRFEDKLAETRHRPLEEMVRVIIDFTLATYLTDKRTWRAFLRIVFRVGLPPALAEGQAIFAQSLASALRERDDVRCPDIDAAAWIVTNEVMGVVHTLVWCERSPFEIARIRDELTRATLAYLEAG